MKQITLPFWALFLIIISSCKTTEKTSNSKTQEPVIASIGGQPVYSSEFSYVYKKNNANSPDAYTEKSVKEYLDLYTKFRLKVKEAETMGLDTSTAFNKELDGYKKQLAQPYLTEKGVTEQLTKEAYERLKTEINASHILIMVSPDADPKDTLSAYNKLIAIRDKAIKGESFEKLAVENSQDPSAKTNKGNLGYFTALQMVYPFEDAAYKTNVGEISKPVRTRFGYHLIKVHNKRPSQGQVRTAHLMVRATQGMSEQDSLAAKNKVDELYKRIKAGENWEQLVTQFSDDINSRSKGGELPWFSTGKMIPAFENTAFALKAAGDISEPVLTPYGWHIIKLLEKKGLEPFEEQEPTLRAKVSKDSRSELNRTMLIKRLKEENKFTENTKATEPTFALADSTLLEGKWNYSVPAKSDQTLFSIQKDQYTTSDFVDYVIAKQKPKKGISPSQYMRVLYKDYVDESLIGYEEKHLAEKYVDYKMLVKEYRDGILLFQLMDEKVWTKAIEDTAGLKDFFHSNREKYKWGHRAHATIYNVKDKATLERLKSDIAKGKYPVKEPKFEKITYSANTSVFSDKDKQVLDQIILAMNKNKALVIELQASFDAKEKASIGSARIDTIKKYLNRNNIAAERILSKELGKTKDRMVSFAMFSTSAKALEPIFNENAALTLQVNEGTYQKGENEILNAVEWKEGNYTIEKDNRVFYVVISKLEDPRLKSFEESRGLAISDYQSYLEEKWVSQLKSKYPVVINEEEVKKIIQK